MTNQPDLPLPPHLFSLHSFRVTDPLNQNVPLEEVPSLAGHASPRKLLAIELRPVWRAGMAPSLSRLDRAASLNGPRGGQIGTSPVATVTLLARLPELGSLSGRFS